MKMDYVFDLHTASAGRQNALYVRADMNDTTVCHMAENLCPQIIVHNSSPGGSVRGCAQQNGIKALTIEVRGLILNFLGEHSLTRSRLEILASSNIISSRERSMVFSVP